MKRSFLSVLAFTMLFFASCKRDGIAGLTEPISQGTNGKAEIFNASLPTNLAVKAGNWNASDSIGIVTYALKDSTLLNQGVKYITTGDGKFTSSTPIPYPAGTLVNFIAFYPYQSNITDDIYKLDVSAQNNIDEFMYANSATNFNTNSQTIPYLAFQSQFAAINLTISASAGVDDINGVLITIPDIATKADFNLKTGSISNLQTQAIVPKTVANLDTQTASIIALAGGDMSGKLVTLRLTNGREYTWTFPSGSVLTKGSKNTYKITLQPPVEQRLFLEKCGEKNVSVATLIKDFTGWDNPMLAFSDYTSKTAIRLNSAMDGNHVYLSGGQSTFKIENINTKYARKLKLTFNIAAGTAGVNQNQLKLKYNGQDFALPDVVLSDITKRQTITIDLSAVPVSDVGVIEFSNVTPGSSIYPNIRIDDVELIGTR